MSNKLNLAKRALTLLFGIAVSIMIIIWLIINLTNLSSESSIGNLILNSLLIIIVLGLIHRILFTKPPNGNNTKEKAFHNLIINMIFYIPCIFTNLFDNIITFLDAPRSSEENTHWKLLLVSISLFLLYFALPFIYNFYIQQGGTLYIHEPVYTNKLTTIGTYQDLNNNTDYDYNYAISFWAFFDAFSPSTNPSYNKYTSIVNYADKPNILYNSQENTLLITMKYPKFSNLEHNPLDLDKNGNRILLKRTDILLQKWNNIIINYNGGTFDIFLNGELIKSNIDVVPYYTLDNLTVGQQNGYIGGICNFVYYKRTLTANNINIIYNSMKNKTPPINIANSVLLMKDINKNTV